MQKLRWMRVPGDTVFALGALVLVAFVFLGRKRTKGTVELPAGLRVPAGD
jgi:nitric oxide reductase large subunit